MWMHQLGNTCTRHEGMHVMEGCAKNCYTHMHVNMHEYESGDK